MATIAPFRGVLFNQPKAGPIDKLVCPPYDIISHEQQQALYRRHPHNVIRLEFGLESPADTESDNRYTRAAALLEDWLRTEILHRSQDPAFYIYEMEYKAARKLRNVRGFICLVRLEDYDSGIIRPHETTLSGPKTDRLNLLRSCKAMFSQIYSLISDPRGIIGNALQTLHKKPDLEATDPGGVIHRLWTLTDRQTIDAIIREAAGTAVFIADGHHRYDTALNYRNERRKAMGSYTGTEEFNFVPMFLARIEDPGVTILPAHRALFNLEDFHPAKFEQDLGRYFTIDRIDFTKRSEAADRRTILDTMERRADRAHVFCMRVKGEHSYYLLTLRNDADLSAVMPGRSEAYRRLDVSILHHVIIDALLGIKMETHKLGLNIEYIKDSEDAVKRVETGEAQVIFLMNPTKVTEVRDVASGGERMPQKATYFYPKLLTGMVMHKIE